MSKAKDAVITVKSVFNGTKTDRQAFIDLILQRQPKIRDTRTSNENISLNRKEIVDENPKIGYNDGTPNMRYTQATGGNV